MLRPRPTSVDHRHPSGSALTSARSSPGTVTVTSATGSSITTAGDFSNGLYATSIGDFAGSGGNSYGVIAFGSTAAPVPATAAGSLPTAINSGLG
jgi:hypothetical protein